MVEDFLDANLIRVAPECHDTARLACLYHGTLAKCTLSETIKECIREERNTGDWDSLFDLCPPCRVVTCCRFIGVASSMK
jgi:hypothetical protein